MGDARRLSPSAQEALRLRAVAASAGDTRARRASGSGVCLRAAFEGRAHGKRRMLVIAMALVLAGSLIAPLAGLPSLIAARALQGSGTALVPVGMSIMRDELPGHRVGGAVALLSATLGIGGGVGIPLGGAFLGAFGRQSLFWLSAVLSMVSIIAIRAVLSGSPSRDRTRFDLSGAVLLSAALLLLLLAVSKGGAWGWAAGETLACLLVGVLAGLLWGPGSCAARPPSSTCAPRHAVLCSSPIWRAWCSAS